MLIGYLRKSCFFLMALVATITLSATLLLSGGVVHAQSLAPTTHTVGGKKVFAPLTLDCMHLSATQHTQAVQKGLCLSNRPGPDNTVYGDCGDSWIYLIEPPNYYNKATAIYGADSTQGPIIQVSWTWNLSNWLGSLNNWSGSAWPWNSSWSTSTTFDFSQWGSGFYTATLTGLTVWTPLGPCWGLVPSDTEYLV
jgi:hypothetical protein